jgi:hypothetical protein
MIDFEVIQKFGKIPDGARDTGGSSFFIRKNFKELFYKGILLYKIKDSI